MTIIEFYIRYEFLRSDRIMLPIILSKIIRVISRVFHVMLISFLILLVNIGNACNDTETAYKICDVLNISNPVEIDNSSFLLPIIYLNLSYDGGDPFSTYLVICNLYNRESISAINQPSITKLNSYNNSDISTRLYAKDIDINNPTNPNNTTSCLEQLLISNATHNKISDTDIQIIAASANDDSYKRSYQHKCVLDECDDTFNLFKPYFTQLEELCTNNECPVIDVYDFFRYDKVLTQKSGCKGIIIVSDDGNGNYLCQYEVEFLLCNSVNCQFKTLFNHMLQEHKKTCPTNINSIEFEYCSFSGLPQCTITNSTIIMNPIATENEKKGHEKLRITRAGYKSDPVTQIQTSDSFTTAIAHGHSTTKETQGLSNERYPCKECTNTFDNKIQLSSHNKHTYKCSLCLETFNCHLHFNNHLTHHETNLPQICNVCHQRYKDKKSLRRHEILHKTNNLYVCNKCTKTFKTYQKLTQHKKTHSIKKPYVCAECDRNFDTQIGLNMHIKSELKKIYKCPDCNKTFKTIEKLNKHTEVIFVCPKCHIIFKCEENYKTHLSSHTILSPVQQDHFSNYFNTQVKVQMPKTSYQHIYSPTKCLGCSKVFSDIKTLHLHNKYKFECSQCCISFICATALSKHRDSYHHYGEYKCIQCNQICFSDLQLKEHEQIHEQPQPKQ